MPRFRIAAWAFAVAPLAAWFSHSPSTSASQFNVLDNGQYYGYLDDPSLLGAAALNPHDPFFARMRPDAIKAAHGHFQHVARADPGDDFPYADFEKEESLRVTATFQGKKRPVYFSWSLELDPSHRPTAPPDHWAQAVNLRDDRYIRFFIDPYVRRTLWRPPYSNYWVMVDNCTFRYDLYGVLDDQGIFQFGVPWDPPYAANEREFLDSIVYFLHRLKQLAPDIRIMGNEGSLADESDYERIWEGFDGSVREEINAGFEGDAAARKDVYKFYRRYLFLAGAGKVAILRSLLPAPDAGDFEDKLRTSYVTYLIFRGEHFFYGPRLDDGTARGISPEAYADMQTRLGFPVAPARTHPSGAAYQRLYTRECEGGTVYLNYTGEPQHIELPKGSYDRDGNRAAAITIPDLQGDYVLKSPQPRTARPLLTRDGNAVVITPSAGAIVRCTTTGLDPQLDSPLCAGAINPPPTATLKARAFSPGKLPSFLSSSSR